MSAAKFDRKLGVDFLSTVPLGPGIYRVFDASGALVYVGKATSLRRRLSQYRLATRRKAHRKMLAIIDSAARIEIETCASEHDARVLEARLIQQHRPRANVDGAFSFLYPFVGLARDAAETRFCYTTHADLADDFELHGAYRSSELTWTAFSALMTLLGFVGHRSRTRRTQRSPVKGFYAFRFRRLDPSLLATWAAFFSGESRAALRDLTLALVENADARGSAGDVQEALDALVRFWLAEAQPLFEARRRTGYARYPVAQHERDVLFVRARHAVKLSEEAGHADDERSERAPA
jgi:hypothetical protein